MHNQKFHKGTKHIDVEFHIIHEHEHQLSGTIINIAYIGTNDRKSNILTKALMTKKFNEKEVSTYEESFRSHQCLCLVKD